MHTITFIFLCTRLDDTYETTQMHILIKTFTVCLCDNYNFHELDRWFSSWAYIWHIFQSMLRRDSVCMHSHRAFTALSQTQSVCLYGIFYQSMLKQALACVQPHQSLHCSHTCAKWAYIRHILSVNAQTSLLSVNAQTSLSMRAVSPEPSLLSHMRKMGIHTAYSFSQCSDEPKRVCSLARASTALAHAQNGRKYGIFCQSMLRRDLVCMQSSQSVHCSRTCAKWAYIRHIPSVNAQTSLSVCVCMQSSQSVHCSRTCAKWAYIRHIPSVNAQTSLSVCAVFQEPLLLSHMYKMGVYMAFLKSMLRRDLVCLQSCHWAPSLLSHIHKMSGLWHLLSANAQTSLSMRAVSPEPTLLSRMRKMSVHTAYSLTNAQTSLSVCAVFQEPLLLSHMYKMGVYIAILSVNAQTRLSKFAVLPEPSLLPQIHKMGVFMVSFISQCSNKP